MSNPILAFRLAQAKKPSEGGSADQSTSKNPIEAFRSARSKPVDTAPKPSAEQSSSDDSSSVQSEGNSSSSYSSFSESSAVNSVESSAVNSDEKVVETTAVATSKKRNIPVGDLRERSLAMYKSINSMMTLVNKKDHAPVTKVSLAEAEDTILDYLYAELSGIAPLTPQEAGQIRLLVNEAVPKINQAIIPPESPLPSPRSASTSSTSSILSSSGTCAQAEQDIPTSTSSASSPSSIPSSTQDSSLASAVSASSSSSASVSRSSSAIAEAVTTATSPAADGSLAIGATSLRSSTDTISSSVSNASSNPPQSVHPADVTLVDCAILKGFVKDQLAHLIQMKKIAAAAAAPASSQRRGDYNEEVKLEAVVASSQGGRKAMEDRFIAITQVNSLFGREDDPPQSFFAVYDGHSGSAAAEYCRVHMHGNILRDPKFKDDVSAAFHSAYLKTDCDFNTKAHRESNASGTTSVTILVRKDSIFCANVGDSEAILCRSGEPPVVLTYAHVPDKQEEKERIQKSGGTVVWYGAWRVNGLLSVSRSIGDFNLMGVVIAEPRTFQVTRTPHDEFIVMGSDGLWDVLKHQDVCDFVREQLKTHPRSQIGQLLVEEAIRRKTADNIATIVVFLDSS